MESMERITSANPSAQQQVASLQPSLFALLTKRHPNRLFRIGLPGIDSEIIEVETVEGVEQVGDDYSYTVRISSDHLLDRSNWMAATVSLALSLEPNPHVIHGIIFAVEDVAHPTALTSLVIKIRSPLALLELSRHQRVWRNISAADAAYGVLTELLPANTSVSLEVQGSHEKQAILLQGQESDLEFIQRILSRAGLFMLLRHRQSLTEVVISDSLQGSSSSSLELDYVPQSGQVRSPGTIFGLRSWTELKPRQVAIAGFDPQFPAQSQAAVASSALTDPLVQSQPASRWGEVERFGECGGGRESHEKLAQVYQRAFDAQRGGIEIDTENRLTPGQIVRINNHPNHALNSAYFVISANHQGDQAAAIRGGPGKERASYICRARLLSVALEYADLPKNRLAASGLMVAELEGSNPSQAYIDEEGSYRARLAMDQGDSPPGQATPPLRLLQPYGGRSYGWHWPMLPHTKVAVAGLDGDLERPIMLGALGNQHQPLPVNSANPDQHVLRTPAGHELVFDDRDGAESLSLTAAQKSGELRMEAGRQDCDARVSLSSAQGALEINSGGNFNIACGGNRLVEVAADCSTQVGGDWTIAVDEGEIRWSAGANLSLSAEQGDLWCSAENANAQIDAGESLNLSSGQGMLLKTRHGDATVVAEAGCLAVGSHGDIEIISNGGGKIAIGSDFGIRIDGDGDVVIEGENISLEAKKISLRASEITEN
ncbi:VgrG protein [Halorhodospira halochloris]|uniref:VgrG protein n=1 Tax=Halorhodospira halochloris TaxID=1052 RepID=A0A0X8XCU6_HALHR|nr:type VI secretion system tip protein VgrG [Halorhodospira halochloris]MBK1651705.1 hypothetical protein [Halorhodospira halochloris]BAU58569.1 VgrG protein [Halorhodospira halochloris]